jgi:EAL domain-containing protein (putative c-di-GMP-specific phosphodiesterase class I)
LDVERLRVQRELDGLAWIGRDDFGAGFGTCPRVKNLRVNLLKISFEFVRRLSENPENQHVVDAIVDLAHGFECQTVAERVEDAESFALLKEFGVDFWQRLYLSRPPPL